MEQDSTNLVIRDVLWRLWIIGLILGIIGAFVALPEPGLGKPWFGAIPGGVGLLMVAIPSMLTIRVDRFCEILTLAYRSLLTSYEEEIPLDQIASIDTESKSSSEGTSYRVVITERDGTVTPLRSYYGR